VARKPKRTAEEMLQRTAAWPLKGLSSVQKALLIRISDWGREWHNLALEIQRKNYEAYQLAEKANPGVKPNGKKFLNEIDLYSILGPLRKQEAERGIARARIPANWMLESIKSSVSAYKSFFSLVKNRDLDARPPKAKNVMHFHEVSGCSAFSVRGGRVILAPEIFTREESLVFRIPPTYQASMLSRSIRDAKFIIYRDEPDMAKPGTFWISVTYEIPLPEAVPFVPEQAVYIALGASSIGIVSPKGEEVVPLWRPDKHWKPKADAIEETLSRDPATPGFHRPPPQKGSRKWHKLMAKRAKMLRTMARQQKQDRREVVAWLAKHDISGKLLGHGVHFVVTELVIRSKEGKLADSEKPERGGSLGANWSAQNTGSIAYLADWLSEKVREHGGSVRKHRAPVAKYPSDKDEKKIAVARALRKEFLASL